MPDLSQQHNGEEFLKFKITMKLRFGKFIIFYQEVGMNYEFILWYPQNRLQNTRGQAHQIFIAIMECIQKIGEYHITGYADIGDNDSKSILFTRCKKVQFQLSEE